MADASSVAYDALKMAVEHVLSKIREGKRSCLLKTYSSSTSAP